MRRYLLDTTPLTALLFSRSGAVSTLTPWITSKEAATSLLVYGEVVEYIKGFPDYSTLKGELRKLLRGVYPFAPTYAVLERYADLRRTMRRRAPGLIGDIDTLIAATALEHNLTVVTTDRDYQRVPGLQVNLLPVPSLR